MTTGNPIPEEPVLVEDEAAEGLKRQKLKNSESVEWVIQQKYY